MTTEAMPYSHLGEALATDYFHVREQFSDDQWEHFNATRRFVDREVLPAINDYWEAAELPWPLYRRLAELGLLGEDIKGYGCPGMSPLTRGLINMELHRGDGSLDTFLGVQSGLAMKSIAMHGSEEHKQRWLPALARLDAVGAFSLTEPAHGSDSVALETSARRDGDGWVLDGAKRWIGNASIADVVVVWARSDPGRTGQGLPGREGHAGIRGRGDGGQGRLTGYLAGPTSASTACACRRRRGCRAPSASRTPAASSSPRARPVPGARSGTRSRPTTRR